MDLDHHLGLEQGLVLILPSPRNGNKFMFVYIQVSLHGRERLIYFSHFILCNSMYFIVLEA
jgi:hypothetical protein